MASTHESWPVGDIRHSFGPNMTGNLHQQGIFDKEQFSAMDHFIGLLYHMVHACTHNDSNNTVAGHVS